MLSFFQSKTLVPAHPNGIFLKNYYSFFYNDLCKTAIPKIQDFSHQTHMSALTKGGSLFMKNSKGLFSQLMLKVGRTPDKARQHGCQVVETKTWRVSIRGENSN
jgi:hypothetical protein